MKGTALITGAAKRLGREIALSLSKMGYKIALHYNNSQSEAEELLREIKKKNGECELFNCDFNNEKAVLELIPKVLKSFDDLNLLINNASIFQKANLLDTNNDMFNRHINVNFKAPFFLTKDFATLCKKGQVIHILDSKISRNDNSYCAYTLSKKALYSFMKMSAKELAPSICVNSISPGYILPPNKESKSYPVKNPRKIPLERKGEVHEITEAIQFLIGNKFITGQNIYIDGGDHL